MFSSCTKISVPPTVEPANGQFLITANQGETVTLSFVISRATPAVETPNIMWFYSPNFVSDPISEMVVDITNEPNRMIGSSFAFTGDLLSLTVSNIVQALRVGDDTDEGRYFLVATNPAGTNFSYIDIIVNGMFDHIIHL